MLGTPPPSLKQFQVPGVTEEWGALGSPREQVPALQVALDLLTRDAPTRVVRVWLPAFARLVEPPAVLGVEHRGEMTTRDYEEARALEFPGESDEHHPPRVLWV